MNNTNDAAEPSGASGGYAANGGDMNLIYIGDHFYPESGTMMSPIYTEDGRRSDWGFVQCALRDGATVNIRQATQAERDHYEAQLSRLKREFAMERGRA